jgi:hypothetical protein
MQTVACVLSLRAATVDACKTDDVASSMQIIELSLSYGQRSVVQFFFVSGSPLRPMTNVILILSLVKITLLFLLQGALSDEGTGL